MSHQRTLGLLATLGLTIAGLSLLASPQGAQALPMYAQRSGRTCGNCHVSPTLEDPDGWENPALPDRKCTLACISCHVNPTGGGLRNASGRYYGQSTLSVLHTQERSYSDLAHELLADGALWEYQQRWGRRVQTSEAHPDRTIPSDEAEHEAGIGAGQQGRWTASGSPLGSGSTMSFWDGRYDDLKADPLLQVGGDLRGAYWSGGNSVFPMQIDLHAAVQPVEHLTIVGTLAARGRTTGVDELLTQTRSPVFARNAFVMAHELPYMGWAKAGIFMPSFGTYIDDHTSFTRAWFEQDVSKSEDTVAGVELGAAPNYPYATISLFKNDAAFGADPISSAGEAGWGAAANFGYLDLGWSLKGHAMVKRRQGLGRGDLLAGGFAWGFNPWYYRQDLPFTLMGEVSAGQRSLGGEHTRFVASYAELWWTLRNGLSLRAKHDLGNRDLGTPGSTEQRGSLGLELSPVPGFTLSAFGRALWAAGGAGPQPDVFVQTHLWF